MRYLLLYSLLISQAIARSPIEGGSSAPIASMDYVDIIKLDFPMTQGSCTGTKVSQTLIITAAHCVLSFQDNGVIQEAVRAGQFLGMGEVVAVHVHPKYKEARKKKIELKDRLSSKLTTLYDIAFIELKERKSQRTLPFPSLISEENKPTERKKLELAGYGHRQTFWNGANFTSKDPSSSLQIGVNEWMECPVDYTNSSLSEIEKLTNNVEELLAIHASRIHEIVDGEESLLTNGKAMILSGDSGSPSLEKDRNGKILITGIASNIVQYAEGSGDPGLVIYQDGKILTDKKLDKMPTDWGLREKTSTSFSEVTELLKSNDLLDSSGNPKPGVKIKRYYTRNVKGHYADLSHPENQKFIKSVMK